MRVHKNAIDILILGVFAFAGGFSVNYLLAGTSHAQTLNRMASSFFRVADTYNTKGIEMYVDKGSPGYVIYDMDDGMRFQMGVYPRNPQYPVTEVDLPLAGFSDRKGNLKLLYRLDGLGTNNSPLIIMKDSKGANRMIMGLALKGDQEEPFLSIYDRQGHQADIIGSFDNPLQPRAKKGFKFPWQKG